MPSLNIRKLDPDVYKRLRMRALRHGISMEEEARRIINQAMAEPEKLSEVFLKYFGLENGIDLDLLRDHS